MATSLDVGSAGGGDNSSSSAPSSPMHRHSTALGSSTKSPMHRHLTLKEKESGEDPPDPERCPPPPPPPMALDMDGRGEEENSPSKPTSQTRNQRNRDRLRLAGCFLGIMVSFVSHNLLMEYATSSSTTGGGEGAGKGGLHELSFLLVSSLVSTAVAVIGRKIRREKAVALPPQSFAVLGFANAGSAFFSVRSLRYVFFVCVDIVADSARVRDDLATAFRRRGAPSLPPSLHPHLLLKLHYLLSLRYVIFPVKVIAKSCKPVPIMVIGRFMGKKCEFSVAVLRVLLRSEVMWTRA